jgi:hypothetical protein
VQSLFDHYKLSRDHRTVPKPMPGVFPDYPAPVVRNERGECELIMMRRGMPPPPSAGGFPVTNIRCCCISNQQLTSLSELKAA